MSPKESSSHFPSKTHLKRYKYQIILWRVDIAIINLDSLDARVPVWP